jgi:hypothetical protein
VTLTITRADIARGTRLAAHACPFALAARRAFGGKWAVRSGQLYQVDAAGRTAVYQLDEASDLALAHYDAGSALAPRTVALAPRRTCLPTEALCG